jgi:2-polyprenyl-3-methyl-5-hydroxy-6-metoxy-1,4-benzoquinol methylase
VAEGVVVFPRMAGKQRQIEKFVEILDQRVKSLTAPTDHARTLRLLDMGAGKGYLTFAAYTHLTALGWEVAATGVERRGDLVLRCNMVSF